MISFEQQLNSEQYQVVTKGDGHCLVLAGAGSGKTRTIAYRVAYLLENGVPADEILLVTFTNKAAREMKERIQDLMQDAVAPLTHPSVLPWSGTFHHIAYRLLRQYGTLLGYQPHFTILDSEDSRDLLKLCVKSEGIKGLGRKFPSTKVLLSIISYARNAEITIADVLEQYHPQFEIYEEAIVRIAELYAQKKQEANAMDFDDLLVQLYLLLLKEPQIKDRLSRQFRYILVDEYQDTNRVQSSIVTLLSSHHQNLLVVGDDAQSIYSFRAADISHILSFEQTFADAQIFRLETNYRSTPEILSLANDIIERNTQQYQKALKPHKASEMRPEVHSFVDAAEEASFIAGQVEQLISDGVPLTEIAVLFRAAFHSQALEMELHKRDIAYEFRGGMRFFARAHIKDVLAYLRLYSNLQDTVAWQRVLLQQSGIGSVSVQKVIDKVLTLSDDESLSHAGSVLSAKAQLGWGDFLQVWESMTAVTDPTAEQLILAIIDSSYQEYLEQEYPDYRDRIKDLEQLSVFAAAAPDLATFLAEATMEESYASKKEQESDHAEEKMILSTIHQAKGLEWQAVFVMHLAAGQFPSERSTFDINGLEEERRLFYVAVTRAQQYLYLTYPMTAGFNQFLAGPSLFLEEIPRDRYSDHTHRPGQGSTVFFDPSDDVDDIVYEPCDEDRPQFEFLKSIEDL